MLLVHWLQMVHQSPTAAIVIGSALIIAVSFIPVIPIPLIAAGVGAMLPLPIAVLATWSAASIGAVLKYAFVRLVLGAHAERLLLRYKRGPKILDLCRRHGFFAVLLVRLIPFIPSMSINLAAGIARMSFWKFTLATFIGKFPTMLTFTLAGNELVDNRLVSMFVILSYVLIVALAGWLFWKSVSTRNAPTVSP